jgi:MFS transporter, OFA family, oxalate/formate antiporter
MKRWYPILGGMALNLAFGSLYAWSIFVLPLEREFGWKRADTAWVYTIAILFTVTATVISGRLQDRQGPRVSVIVGGLLLAAGYILSSFTTSLWMLYASFGAVGGFGGGFGYAAPIPVASKWFPDKRGLVVGVMVGAYAAASAVFGSIATYLIGAYGWRIAFRILGVLFVLVTIAGASLLKNPPAGYRPPNWDPPAAHKRRATVPTGAMMATSTFWALWIAFCFGSMAGQMVISQLVPFATSAGLGALAAIVVPVAAIGNIGGRIVSGFLSDRIGRLTTLRMMVLASAVVTPALYVWRRDVAWFFVLMIAVYWCYGTQMSVFASTAADFYGDAHLGMNWGVLLTAWAVAGLVAPFMAGWMFDRFHSYQYAFFIAAAFALLAVASLSAVRANASPKEVTYGQAESA